MQTLIHPSPLPLLQSYPLPLLTLHPFANCLTLNMNTVVQGCTRYADALAIRDQNLWQQLPATLHA